MKLNNKGFTMVELLVAMAIMGLLIIMAFPTIRAIQTNNTKKKFESFGQTLLSGAKLYVDSYGEDLFTPSAKNETTDIAAGDMVKKQIVQSTIINETDCSESKVFVVKYDEDYTYCLYLLCKSKTNAIAFQSNDMDKKEQCKHFQTVSINYVYNGVTKKDVKTKGITNYSVLSPSSLFSNTSSTFDKWSYNGSTYSPGAKISGPINNNITLTATFKNNSNPSPNPDPNPDPNPGGGGSSSTPTPDPSGKPTCTITPNSNPNASGWFKQDVTLTLNKSSNATNYGLDTKQSSTNKATSKVVSTEGTITYYGFVSNSAGSNQCSYTVYLDKTAPTITVTPSNDKYTLTAKLTDNTSNLASFKWKTGSNTATSGATKTVKTSVGTSDGKYSITATDKAGNSATKNTTAYKWCTKKDKIDDFAIYRWRSLTKNCSSYYRKYRFYQYTCTCVLDKKNHDHVCSKSTHEENHGSDYSFVYYKHNANGRKACNGTYEPNSYVSQVCASNSYPATNHPTFDYHGYRFFGGSAKDGWTNFGGTGYTYWRKGMASNGLTPDAACAEACKKRN